MSKSNRNESMNKIIEICEKPKTRVEIIRDGVPQSTVYRNLQILIKRGILVEVAGYDNKGRSVTKYQNVKYRNIVDSKYLRMIIDNYNSGNKVRKNIAVSEMCDLSQGSDKRIFDKDFIDFIIEEPIKNSFEPNDDMPFLIAFDDIITKLQKDIIKYPEDSDEQIELLTHIQKKAGNHYKQVISDSSEELWNKALALSNLKLMNHPEMYILTFELLKTMKFLEEFNISSEELLGNPRFQAVVNRIKDIIKSYSEINLVDCKRRLWEAYDFQTDKRIKNLILFLLKVTSLGYNSEHDEEGTFGFYMANKKPKIN